MMTSIINVLSESLRLLGKRPALFVPKLVTTLTGAFWFIGFLSNYGPLYLYLATAPFLVVSSVFGAVMLAAMVKEKGSEKILRKGFIQALEKWKGVAFSAALIFLLSIAVMAPLMAGVILLYMTGQLLLPVLGGLISFVLLVVMTFLIYFFPISLVEKGSVLEGFRDSATTSISNSSEVMALTVLSFALLGVTSLVGDSSLKAAGYAGFIVMRVVSGIITTYVFVVSPEYYLSD